MTYYSVPQFYVLSSCLKRNNNIKFNIKFAKTGKPILMILDNVALSTPVYFSGIKTSV